MLIVLWRTLSRNSDGVLDQLSEQHNVRWNAPETAGMCISGGRAHYNLPPDGRPMGPADVGEVAKLGKVVAGAGSDHNLRSEQAKMVAGRCTRNNLERV